MALSGLFYKRQAAAILDNRKSLLITFLAISESIRNIFLNYLFTNWPFWTAILDDRKSLLIAFLAISDGNFYFLDFVLQNGRRRPFWILTENHFRSHFSPFSINTQLYFFLFFFQNGRQWPFWMHSVLPKSIGTSLYSRSVSTSNVKLMGEFLIKLCSAQAFSSNFHKMAAGPDG